MRKPSRQTSFWISPLSIRKTARAATARKGAEEQRSHWRIPVYLAIVDEASVRKVIANGVHGTTMPAFAQSAGGMLTDKQIDAITRRHILNLGTQGNSRRKQSAFVCGQRCGQEREW